MVSVNLQNNLYIRLLTLITESGDVQEASQILSQGAPIEPTSATSSKVSALALAIELNRVGIIELLLAAGAPLTAKHYGKTLLQLAWFSQNATIKVKMIITRVSE